MQPDVEDIGYALWNLYCVKSSNSIKKFQNIHPGLLFMKNSFNVKALTQALKDKTCIWCQWLRMRTVYCVRAYLTEPRLTQGHDKPRVKYVFCMMMNCLFVHVNNRLVCCTRTVCVQCLVFFQQINDNNQRKHIALLSCSRQILLVACANLCVCWASIYEWMNIFKKGFITFVLLVWVQVLSCFLLVLRAGDSRRSLITFCQSLYCPSSHFARDGHEALHFVCDHFWKSRELRRPRIRTLQRQVLHLSADVRLAVGCVSTDETCHWHVTVLRSRCVNFMSVLWFHVTMEHVLTADNSVMDNLIVTMSPIRLPAVRLLDVRSIPFTNLNDLSVRFYRSLAIAVDVVTVQLTHVLNWCSNSHAMTDGSKNG